ncbi:hypothetical protein ACGF07_10300 [Kitasatospora sp. NPDC048194]|uniref:hypothetical protein n=1 Tax=Kitasatospora sp. NPDC048194 TaxID=3364045 RepID=UPI003722D9F1
MRTTSPAEESTAPSLRAAWQTLADGLLIQRLQLHIEEWREIAQAGGSLPDISGVPVAGLALRPTSVPGPEAQTLLQHARLSYWWSYPQQHGADGDASAVGTVRAAEQARKRLLADGAAAPWVEAVIAACEASAWWVGFFAVIRHRGVRHLTLEPNPGPIPAQVLEGAVSAVAYGMAGRVLAAALRAQDDERTRRAFCEAITASIEVERTLPALLDELGELRLVDLVSTTAVWRGQFTKYAGGTGAGQVE